MTPNADFLRKFDAESHPLRKADMLVANLITDGGYLPPTAAKQFFLDAIKGRKLLEMCTVTTMDSHTMTLDAISFQDTVLQPATESQELLEAERSKPDTRAPVLTTQEYAAAAKIGQKVLEDNIMQDAMRRVVNAAFANAVGRDIEDQVINGDTASTVTGKRGNLLRHDDGMLKKITSYTVDAGGARINSEQLTRAWKILPSQHHKDKAMYRVLCSTNGETDWARFVSFRGTTGGDNALLSNQKFGWMGIGFEAIPLFPDSLGVSLDQSVMVLANPKNFVVGVWRKVAFSSEVNIAARCLTIHATTRHGCQFQDESAVVEIINLKTGN